MEWHPYQAKPNFDPPCHPEGRYIFSPSAYDLQRKCQPWGGAPASDYCAETMMEAAPAIWTERPGSHSFPYSQSMPPSHAPLPRGYQQGAGTMPLSFPTWSEDHYNSYNPMMYDCWDNQYTSAPIHREEQKYIPPQDILEFDHHSPLTAVGKASSLVNGLFPRREDSKPMKEWSPTEVIEWLCQEARKNNIEYEDLYLKNFHGVDGHQLLNMSVNEFLMKDDRYGRILHDAMIRHRENEKFCFNDNLPPFGDIKQDDVIYTVLGESPCRRNELSVLPDNDSYISDASSHEAPEMKPLDIPKAPVSTGGRRPVGRPPKQPRQKRGNKEKKCGRLWEFIRDLLLKPEYCPSLICWENHDEGIFRFVRSDKVAELWGTIKDNPKMTYEKLSRAMRYYYKSQVLLPVLGRRLVYKFGPTARGWRTDNPNFRDSTK